MKVIVKRCIFALSVVIVLVSTAGFAFAQQTWQRNYGGADTDKGESVQQTTDGGYIVAGWTYSFGNGYQVYLIKTNASGDTLWTRTYGGPLNDRGNSVQQTTDGGYIVAGVYDSFGANPQVCLIKTNARGDTLWTRTYGGSGMDWGYSVQQTTDGGYIVAGYTTSYGNLFQVYLIKTNTTGDTLWTRTYGGAAEEMGHSVQQTQDGGYIVAGETGSYPNYDVYLIKTNATGNTIWTRTYGGTNEDVGYSVQQTTDGGYIVAGWTYSFGYNEQFYLIKTNASGDTLWTRTYGGPSWDEGHSVQQTQDGGYVVAGFFQSETWAYLIKTNATGNTLWTRTYGSESSNSNSVRQTSDGGYIVAGWTYTFANGNQVYLVKTDANGTIGIEEENQRSKIKDQKYRITPNPFASFAAALGHEREDFAVYDIAGKMVGVFRGDHIGVGLAPGIYFIRSESADVMPLRIVKVR